MVHSWDETELKKKSNNKMSRLQLYSRDAKIKVNQVGVANIYEFERAKYSCDTNNQQFDALYFENDRSFGIFLRQTFRFVVGVSSRGYNI